MPVKETEIRIGNWFNHLAGWSYRTDKAPFVSKYFQWEDRDWYQMGECCMSLEYIEPIPISSDILEVSGFKKEEIIHKNEWFPNGISTITYSKEYNSTKSLRIRLQQINDEVYYICENTNEYVEAIHDIQNIFFIFFKEELNIIFP